MSGVRLWLLLAGLALYAGLAGCSSANSAGSVAVPVWDDRAAVG